MFYLNYPVFGKASKYAFANAVLAVIEGKMLTQAQVDQMYVAGSLKELVRMFSDTIYAQYFEDGADIAEIAEKESIRAKLELYEILPPDDHFVFDMYYKRYDYNNLKILLKSHFLNKPVNASELSAVGCISPQELMAYFEEERFDDLPFLFSFSELEAEFQKSKEMRLVDSVLDRAYYREFLDVIYRKNDDFLVDYLRQQIDLKNFLVLVRCSRTNLNPENYFLDGGYIDLYTLAGYAGEPPDSLLTAPDFAGYRLLLRHGVEALEKKGSFSELETTIKNHAILHLRDVRDFYFTIKPFVAYMIAKEHEIHVVKKIYIHIKNNIAFGSEKDIVYYV